MGNSETTPAKAQAWYFRYFLPRIAIAYCNLEFLGLQPETPKTSYIFNIGIKYSLFTNPSRPNDYQRTPRSRCWTWRPPTTWCRASSTPRTGTCWPAAATTGRCAGGTTGRAASRRARSASPSPTSSPSTRPCGFRARRSQSSSRPPRTAQ